MVAGKSIAIKSEAAAVAARLIPVPNRRRRRPRFRRLRQNQTQQPNQGRRYGQSGFVGEPINLNVVNADVRDILNYITEQYGINFVIDSSVGAVPVTVNVQDVPWNYRARCDAACEQAGRRSQRQHSAHGDVRDAGQGSRNAEESSMMRGLDNSPLVTEFVRLNYARASAPWPRPRVRRAAYAGGATNLSYSGGAGGDATGGSGDQGILPIIKRRLSRRGSVEVEGRSNTLIITDVKENIEAIRQLVAILDQPEPQVEIETRIVIAQRNFSRDLGAQLSLSVVQSAVAAHSVRSARCRSPVSPAATLDNRTASANPYRIRFATQHRDCMGPFQPNGNLGGASPNTVIGLTTGVFGTAQIGLLISAAENRGEVKTVATPRVTALNNRPAQIESGSQIPVQTTQAPAAPPIVTTTFVSVPLRLSITPQITDAGTVVLRVTIENNTVNTAIAVGGVPGIDTQRMQSEVLVPDGGTTVMGGVLADIDSTSRQRTPGAASIPILGNLFKRKTVIKNSLGNSLLHHAEDLPAGLLWSADDHDADSSGPRTTSVPQPVPLGNPQTNTPTPTELQQSDRPQPNMQQNPASPGSQNPPPPSNTARPNANQRP